MSASDTEAAATTDDLADGVLVIRRGPGANCSSIGSAVEMLFLSAAVGAAVLAAVVAAIRPARPAEPERDARVPPTDEPPTDRGASAP